MAHKINNDKENNYNSKILLRCVRVHSEDK